MIEIQVKPLEQVIKFSNPNIEKIQLKEVIPNEFNETIRNKVLEICKNNELACKNDLILYLEYLKLTNRIEIEDFGEHITLKINKENLLKLPMPESISRVRRALRKEELIFYDEETEEKREKHQSEIKNYFHNKKANNDYYGQIDERF